MAGLNPSKTSGWLACAALEASLRCALSTAAICTLMSATGVAGLSKELRIDTGSPVDCAVKHPRIA